MDKKNYLQSKLSQNDPHESIWKKPLQFNLDNLEDRKELEDRFKHNEINTVYDPIEEIANDLFEIKNPSWRNDSESRDKFVNNIIHQENYGNWFLFPWSKELVRYPNKDDYRLLRTARNKNLITEDEQEKLNNSTIAIFGLSIGSNVVKSLVTSGIGKKLVLADQDIITPSNLNRINTKFSDVGTKKIHSLAKNISQIDPYIEQVHLEEGVNDSNIENLCLTNKPDIIIEEIDDLRMKTIIRIFAKKYRIALIMATDVGDKTLLDVERYDEKDEELFNGRLNKTEIALLQDVNLNHRQKKKIMLKMIGLKNLTPRLINSVANKNLVGFPQLGTTAFTGGAIATIGAREIILGRNLPSKRYSFSPKRKMQLSSPDNLFINLKMIFNAINLKQ